MRGETDPQLCDSLGKENEISTFSGQLNSWDVFDRERFKTYPKTPFRITWLELPAGIWRPHSNRPNGGNEILEITIWLKIAGLANISSDLRLYMSFRVSNRTHNLSTNHESICCWEGMNSVRPWLTVNDYHRFGDDVLRMKRRNLELFGRYHERSSWRANRRFENSIIAMFWHMARAKARAFLLLDQTFSVVALYFKSTILLTKSNIFGG
jgi:hypothetical protein